MENEKGFLNAAKLIDWDGLTPDRIDSEIEAALKLAKAEIEAICLVESEEATFENTFMALEKAGETLSKAWGRVDHLTSVKDSKELREAYNKMLPSVTEFNSGIPLNPRLWKAIKGFSEKPEGEGLTGIQKRFFEETIADFVQAGADLDKASKGRLEEMNKEL
ncbi:M3 family peptidase, partial [Opitutaceae bacterium]|nr:M3 family peptidase [Opitutaceae bacterium]